MTTPTTPAAAVSLPLVMSEAHDIGAIIEAIEQYTRGDDHQRAIDAAVEVLRAVESRESALIAERDQLRAAIEVCLSFVHADDRSKPSTDPDLCGEIVRVRLSGLCALAEAVTPGIRLAAHQAFVARTLDALAAPAVEGV